MKRASMATRLLPLFGLIAASLVLQSMSGPAHGSDSSDRSDSSAGQPDAATIVTDMTLRNDQPLKGAPKGPQWATGPGSVIMGSDPRGSNTPDYWKPADASLKSDQYWRAIIPWLVVYPGEKNTAVNTRVQLRDLTVFLQSRKTGKWKRLGQSRGVIGENYPTTIIGADTTTPDIDTTDDGWTSLLPEAGRVFHGWWKFGKLRIDAPDIGNVYVRLQARLVADDGWFSKNDVDKANYLVQVGADYWPDTNTKLSAAAPTGYIPGVGGSRFKLIRPQWQWISFTTVPAEQVASLLPPELHQ